MLQSTSSKAFRSPNPVAPRPPRATANEDVKLPLPPPQLPGNDDDKDNDKDDDTKNDN